LFCRGGQHECPLIHLPGPHIFEPLPGNT